MKRRSDFCLEGDFNGSSTAMWHPSSRRGDGGPEYRMWPDGMGRGDYWEGQTYGDYQECRWLPPEEL